MVATILNDGIAARNVNGLNATTWANQRIGLQIIVARRLLN